MVGNKETKKCSGWKIEIDVDIFSPNPDSRHVTDEMVEQLQPGMSRRQVRFVMGTPLVEDTFNPDRWDYHYVKRNGTKTLSENQLTVFFEGDALVNVTGTNLPTWAQDSASEEPAEDDA